MPTVTVDKAALFEKLGRTYTTEEFDELCFEFGIELDEDTEHTERPVVNGVQQPPQLKIDIPANRYDLLCIEGIQLALNIFIGRAPIPTYKLVEPANGQFETIHVKEETSQIRPYIAGAILRNIHFDQAGYDSFIALQDKLHQNLARQRTLVAIGTHDLDTIKGPFTYEARAPTDIKFTPLNQTKEMNGAELMEFYEKDKHLGKYLHIIKDSPVYPVIYDSRGTVCSLPPIINGDHSKISVNTRNVFLEYTATDKTKLEIVNNIMVLMFSQHCDQPFTVEPVRIVSEHNGQTRTVPNLEPRNFDASISYINACCGLELPAEKICESLTRMAYTATPSKTDSDIINVHVPVTRADVLHQADIMEDVAIAYGFNELPRSFPTKSATIAQPLPINKLTDIIRTEAAMAGWVEVLPLILCSHDENFGWLNRVDDGNTAIRLANPKTIEFQVVRTSLVPGLLKTIRENRKHTVPMTVFEVSDVAFKDMSLERKSRNERHFAAAWYAKSAGFEIVHGLLDRIMAMLKSAYVTREEGLKNDEVVESRYWIEELNDPMYFPGHAATVHLSLGGKNHVIGEFGILHPTVLDNFDLKYPVSTLEINIEKFL